MNRDYSLLDANLGRAREGLRVLDETARFLWSDRELFKQIKDVRHQLVEIEQVIGAAHLLSGRHGEDVGGPDNEIVFTMSAPSLWSIIQANSNRVTEAMRVLEQVGPIYFPTVVEKIIRLRYEVYGLQKILSEKTPHYWLRYYFEQGIVYPISDSVTELEWLVLHGARVTQLRDKQSDGVALFEKAKQLVAFIADFERRKKEKVLLFINDNIAVAELLPVAGVHIGQADNEISTVRRRVGMLKLIGRSNQSLEQMQKSAVDGADYVSIGPVFDTPLKPERAPVGLEMVRAAAATVQAPWVVIGGIDQARADEVRQAGAKNMAVIRAARDFFPAHF